MRTWLAKLWLAKPWLAACGLSAALILATPALSPAAAEEAPESESPSLLALEGVERLMRDAKVTQIDPSSRRLTLSVKALEIAEEKKAMADYGSSDSGASLGDILGAAIKAKAEGAANADDAPAADEEAAETPAAEEGDDAKDKA